MSQKSIRRVGEQPRKKGYNIAGHITFYIFTACRAPNHALDYIVAMSNIMTLLQIVDDDFV